jgi:ubiquitin carboxyl-terminal hydrolase 14
MITQHAVDFPHEFNALDFVTDNLKVKLVSLNCRLMEVKAERVARMTQRRSEVGPQAMFNNMLHGAISRAFSSESGRSTTGIYSSDVQRAWNEQQEADAEEIRLRDEEKILLQGLVDSELKNDMGCSVSGLYDLTGRFLTLVPGSFFKCCFDFLYHGINFFANSDCST